MTLVLKKSIGFVVLLFIIGICVDYYTGKAFSFSYFVWKSFGCVIAGVLYYFIMSYFSKKAR